MAMTLRQEAIEWLERRCGFLANPVHVSKLYDPDESWNHEPVWWFEFPESVLDDEKVACIDLLCQLVGGPEPFVHLRVPTSWLREHRAELHVRPEKGISVYLSSVEETLYRERRGGGSLDFSGFVR